jgi:hypothetical protein
MELTNEQVEFMRADLQADMGYSKIIMIAEFSREFKLKYEREHSGAPAEEVRIKTLDAIKAFRIQKGWDPRNPEACQTCWHQPYRHYDNVCEGCECQNRSCKTCPGWCVPPKNILPQF